MENRLEAAHERGEIKVIGAGFGRTGTLSLKVALEQLGFGPCYHMLEIFELPDVIYRWLAITRGAPADWHQIFKGYQATVDWPGCSFYQELMQTYPEAKVLLTVREPENWYESISSTIYPISQANPDMPVAQLTKALVWERTFHGRFEEKEYALALFQEHIESVKRHVPPERLLVFDVKEGWGPLCAFLEVEVPDQPFPHLNPRTIFSGSAEEVQNALMHEKASLQQQDE